MNDGWQLTQWQGENGTVTQIHGSLSLQDVAALSQALLGKRRSGESLALDFSQCDGDLDVALPLLLRQLERTPGLPPVSLWGLTLHQRRLLAYLGYAEHGPEVEVE